MLKPCINCGVPGPESRCPDHARAVRRDGGWSAENARRRFLGRYSAHARGYDQAWRRLSARARRAQPFCTDCGSWGSNGNPLTADHSPEAWQRHNNGLPIRLSDVDVLCRICNSARGAVRVAS